MKPHPEGSMSMDEVVIDLLHDQYSFPSGMPSEAGKHTSLLLAILKQLMLLTRDIREADSKKEREDRQKRVARLDSVLSSYGSEPLKPRDINNLRWLESYGAIIYEIDQDDGLPRFLKELDRVSSIIGAPGMRRLCAWSKRIRRLRGDRLRRNKQTKDGESL